MVVKRLGVAYGIATVMMCAGWVREQARSHYDVSSIFELCCFCAAGGLLALPLLWLWKSWRENIRLLALLWVVVLQECVCVDEFVSLLRRAL
jgi:hypothetical protein